MPPAASHPKDIFLAPVAAVRQVLEKAKLAIKDIDLFELNEAFAAQMLACNKDLGIDPKRINVHGGAIALGHPIGASGARVLTTLLYALQETHRPPRAGVAVPGRRQCGGDGGGAGVTRRAGVACLQKPIDRKRVPTQSRRGTRLRSMAHPRISRVIGEVPKSIGTPRQIARLVNVSRIQFRSDRQSKSEPPMTAENFDKALDALVEAKPFQVFTVVLNGGRKFEVDHPRALAVRDGVAVFVAARRVADIVRS